MGNNLTEKKCPKHKQQDCPKCKINKKCPKHKQQDCPKCIPNTDKTKTTIKKDFSSKQNYINIIRLLTNKIKILNNIMKNK